MASSVATNPAYGLVLCNLVLCHGEPMLLVLGSPIRVCVYFKSQDTPNTTSTYAFPPGIGSVCAFALTNCSAIAGGPIALLRSIDIDAPCRPWTAGLYLRTRLSAYLLVPNGAHAALGSSSSCVDTLPKIASIYAPMCFRLVMLQLASRFDTTISAIQW
ncbi:hypothetical protein DFP72DRAFT_161346 [Ephemerocybe angulata]|uniref:Uncharacterized protein n=1 Tax=Ephemerocybe angulata TaxID=980116 RepID=A0A8H6I4N7_9AGAR|nr:hypothetical protein DFP72DRAFT_161346 [Tulosesus angulatus]